MFLGAWIEQASDLAGTFDAAIVATPSTNVANQIPHESAGLMLARLGRGGTEHRVLTTLGEITPEGALS